MKLFWTHILNSHAYRFGTANDRRMIEIRYSLARTLRDRRRAARITQKKLAVMIGTTQATISHIERASTHVALDYVVYAFFALCASDFEIGNAFNASGRPDVRRLQLQANARLARQPSAGFARALRRLAANRIPRAQSGAAQARTGR